MVVIKFTKSRNLPRYRLYKGQCCAAARGHARLGQARAGGHRVDRAVQEGRGHHDQRLCAHRPGRGRGDGAGKVRGGAGQA